MHVLIKKIITLTLLAHPETVGATWYSSIYTAAQQYASGWQSHTVKNRPSTHPIATNESGALSFCTRYRLSFSADKKDDFDETIWSTLRNDLVNGNYTNFKKNVPIMLTSGFAINTFAKTGTIGKVGHSNSTGTLLHIAVSHFNNEGTTCAELLLDNGANVDIQNNDGKTPLHIAVAAKCNPDDLDNQIAMVELLLQRGAHTDIPDHGAEVTPLFFAENVRIARLLLDRGASITFKSWHGFSPIFYIDDLPTVALLAARGASLNERGKIGKNTMLHHYSSVIPSEYPDKIGAWLRLGANVNAQNDSLRTALHEAVCCKNAPYVRLLLSYKPNVLLQDKRGRTALHSTTYIQDRHICWLILHHAWKHDVLESLLLTKDEEGRTAQELARINNHQDLATMLGDLEKKNPAAFERLERFAYEEEFLPKLKKNKHNVLTFLGNREITGK